MNRIKRYEFEADEVQTALVEYLERHYGLEVGEKDGVALIAEEEHGLSSPALTIEVHVNGNEEPRSLTTGEARGELLHAPSPSTDIRVTACGLSRDKVEVVPPKAATCQRCRDTLGLGYPE